MITLLAEVPGQFNANTIFISGACALILGAIGWVGRKSSDNNDKLTGLAASFPYLESSIRELKTQMGGMVTRPELDSKIAQIKVDQAKIEVEIIKLQQHAIQRERI